MSVEEKQLRSKIQFFEDLLLLSKNFNEQLKLHGKLTMYNKSLAKMLRVKNDPYNEVKIKEVK